MTNRTSRLISQRRDLRGDDCMELLTIGRVGFYYGRLNDKH